MNSSFIFFFITAGEAFPDFIFGIFGILSNVTSNDICCVLQSNDNSLDGVNVVFVSLCSEVCDVLFLIKKKTLLA